MDTYTTSTSSMLMSHPMTQPERSYLLFSHSPREGDWAEQCQGMLLPQACSSCSQAGRLCPARLLQLLTAGLLAEEWPRGACGPHHASMEAGKEELTVSFPGVTTVVLLESYCLLVINEDHQTDKKRNPLARHSFSQADS